MTVKELIEILKTQDEGSRVIVAREGGGFVEANTAWAKVLWCGKNGDEVAFLISKD